MEEEVIPGSGGNVGKGAVSAAAVPDAGDVDQCEGGGSELSCWLVECQA